MTDPNDKQNQPNMSHDMNDDPDSPPPMQERHGEGTSGEETDIFSGIDMDMQEDDAMIADDQVTATDAVVVEEVNLNDDKNY